MNILFTGASSFTGYWFVCELVKCGHTVTAPLLRDRFEYSGIRRERVESLLEIAKVVYSCPFGSDSFLDLIRSEKWDLICHHAAEVTDYKNPQFNYVHALEMNAYRIEEVLKHLITSDCYSLAITGSVFEQGEGLGDLPLRALSPYGLSKGFTSAVFEYQCSRYGIRFQKFVIPNPFGSLEEERFTSYLAKSWLSGKIPTLQCPGYVRDNIPVTLLAKVYAHFIEQKLPKMNPSYHPDSMEAFTSTFAKELEKRFSISCFFECNPNPEYTEPLVRKNSELIDISNYDWSEEEFWDELALFYARSLRMYG